MTHWVHKSETIKRIQEKVHYGLFIHTLLGKFRYKGINIRPYYLVREQLVEHFGKKFDTGFDEFEIGFLKSKDMAFASYSRNVHEKAYLKRLDEGKKCFGVKFNGELAALMWVDLEKCNFQSEMFSLQQNEAYLYDTWTSNDFRGKGIAPYMRYQCYKALNKLYRNKFYSITEYFNTPAVKFKKRLGAKNIKLRLFVELFRKYNRTFEIKRYE